MLLARALALTLVLASPALAQDDQANPPPPQNQSIDQTFSQNEIVQAASGFFGTNMASYLTLLGCDSLIVTGTTTSGCVRATAVDAVQNGFRPMVVREAVGDRSAAAHEQSLFDLNAKYADVVSLDETLQYLKTVGHNRPAN